MTDIAELVKRADAETRNGDLGPDHIALFSQLAQALTAQAKEIAEKDAELLISDGIIAGLRLDVARLEEEVATARWALEKVADPRYRRFECGEFAQGALAELAKAREAKPPDRHAYDPLHPTTPEERADARGKGFVPDCTDDAPTGATLLPGARRAVVRRR